MRANSNSMGPSTVEGTQVCTDLSFLAFPAAASHPHSSQSIEHLKSQVSDPSTEAILLKTELPKQNLRVCLPKLLVVLISKRVQPVYSTMHIPRVLQNPKIRTQPSRTLHPNSLQRLQA
jgi:hypothetical protein